MENKAKKLLKILKKKIDKNSIENIIKVLNSYKKPEVLVDFLDKLDYELSRSYFYITLNEKIEIHNNSKKDSDFDEGLTIFSQLAHKYKIEYSMPDGDKIVIEEFKN